MKQSDLRLKQQALSAYTTALIALTLNPNPKTKHSFKQTKENLIKYLGYRLAYNLHGHPRWKEIE